MPDFGRLFRQIYQLLRTSPSLWWLAFWGAFSLESVNTTAVLIATSTTFNDLTPEQFFAQVVSWGENPSRLVILALVGTFILAIVWVIATITTGGIIVGTHKRTRGEPFSFGEGLYHGRRLLWPFIATDTLIFLPIFILALSMLASIASGLIYAVSQNTVNNDAINILIISLLCTIPLILLMIPVGIFTTIYRYITFRDIAINNTPVRASIKRVWPIIKEKWQSILLLFVLVISLSALPTAVVRLFTALTAFLPLTAGTLISALFRLAINIVLHLVLSMLWTLVMLTWWPQEGQGNANV